MPPILSGTYAGIQGVDPAARDAAKGMGMRGSEVLRKVELPCSLPLLLSGIRSATLQVIATATIAASISLGGLGRYLIDGLSVSDYAQMASGAILVAVLALIMDGILALIQRARHLPGTVREVQEHRRRPRGCLHHGPRRRRLGFSLFHRPCRRPERSTRMKRTILMTGAAAVAALALAACGANNNPTAPAGGGGGSTASGGGSGSITVGSADFSESQVLGEIYAGAIKAKGISVTTKPNIGSRDVYIKALEDGSIDIVPEYTGSLLTYLKGTAPTQDPDAVYTALKSTLPPTLVVLDKSTAEDKNSIVVTKDTQSKYSLKSIADLTAHQAEITVAAPPEFQQRDQGLVGLKAQYGFTPANFLPLKGAAIVNALLNGQAQAANIFSTDPSISSNGFVTLEDPKLLFGSDNVVPLLRKDKVNDTITAALNAVSAKIDTATLTDLVKQVDVDKKDASAVAKDFLSKNGLG